MAKTYPDIGTFTSGQILTAATMNQVGDNLDNQRVPPSVTLHKNSGSNQSLTNNTQTAITWDTADVNTDAMWTSGSTVTIGTAGLYLFTGGALFDNNSTSYRILYVVHITSGRLLGVQTTQGMGFTAMTVSAVYSCAAGDTVRMDALQNSGGALNVLADMTGNRRTFFSAVWLGQVS